MLLLFINKEWSSDHMGFSGIFGNAGVVEPEKLESDYGQLMCDGETIEIGFVVIRDTFIFTNKRLIIVDVQGMTGKKRSYLSIPYSKITKYSIETSGHFDLDAELKIWVGSDPQPIEKTFNKKVDIYELQKVLSTHVLG
ncbi:MULTISPECIES: PH domain-containing protein [Methanohalophilus]|nr:MULTISPECIES: PH domain-containing protein [Methanohalophilus]